MDLHEGTACTRQSTLTRLIVLLLSLSVPTSVLALAQAGDEPDAPETGQAAGEDGTAEAEPAEVEPAEPEPVVPKITGDPYPVTSFTIDFQKPIEGLEPESLLKAEVNFSVVNNVYTAPQPGAQQVRIALNEFGDGRERQFDATALRSVVDGVLSYINQEVGLIGVVVTPHPNDIDLSSLEDLREAGDAKLRLVVYTARVGRIRTLGSGDRVAPGEREDSPLHEPIREHSPLKPGAEGEGDVIWKYDLDQYLYRLNRHPGRRVDAAISAGQTAGDVTLDYLVSESKPWYVFFQLSNTGTDSTDELRERFGFVHNQLTGSDDIFAIDYVTANFEDYHALSLSYERPFTERLSGRVNARYSEYEATDVGIITQQFSGDDYLIGGDLIYTLAQFDELFVDVVGGLSFLGTRTENSTLAAEGSEQFLLGHVALRAERQSDISQFSAYVDLQWTFNSGDAAELVNMGRINPDESFAILTAGTSASFYLEPLLNYDKWADINDPDTSTLAHELLFGVRGQSSLGNRLIPTFQTVAGGAYSVRGYDESATAADNSIIATVEYRFHLPRALGIRDPDTTPLFGEPFRVTPETVYGQADWDLIFKAFFDAARITFVDNASFENDETLLSAGVGFEVSVKNNIRFRGDWGFVLEDAGPNEVGDQRFHFFLTLLY